jgi:hypothetical protein
MNPCVVRAGACTLLDISEGTSAGLSCGIIKSFGEPSSNVLGGQNAFLKVRAQDVAAMQCLRPA